MSFTNKLRAYYRAFCGVCPACNSDAPAIDKCQCCKSYRNPNGGYPSARRTAYWLYVFMVQETGTKD